jgi:mRNA interferase RelE/StbE
MVESVGDSREKRQMRVDILRSAQKEIERLPSEIIAHVQKRILGLADTPIPRDSIRLKGSDHYRIRAGDYRIIYLVDRENEKVVVTRVRHRREAYRS